MRDIIGKGTENLDISFVINNAGLIDTEEFRLFSETNPLINTNSLAPALISNIFLKWFKSRFEKTKYWSGLMNIESVSAGVPTPYFTAYAASKAHLRSLTLALAEECKEYCDVMSVAPGAMNTRMTGFLKEDYNNSFTSLPIESARGTLRDMGYERLTNGTLCHELFDFVMTTLYSLLGDQYVNVSKRSIKG
jgi:short-subunit dehydrogenase